MNVSTNITQPDFNTTLAESQIHGDWDLSTVEWVVFIACVTSIVLLAMFIVLLARYRNQKDDDDWREASRPRKSKSSVTAEAMRPSASSTQPVIAESNFTNGVGSQTSISPIVVPSENISSPLRPGAMPLSASVPAVNIATPPRPQYTLTGDSGRPRGQRSEMPFAAAPHRLRAASSTDRAPSPVIWPDSTPGSQASRRNDPIYGYSQLAAQQGMAGQITAKVDGEYDDVVQAQMRSHRVTTPVRQSHHYDHVAS